jgi:hypothetical protein
MCESIGVARLNALTVRGLWRRNSAAACVACAYKSTRAVTGPGSRLPSTRPNISNEPRRLVKRPMRHAPSPVGTPVENSTACSGRILLCWNLLQAKGGSIKFATPKVFSSCLLKFRPNSEDSQRKFPVRGLVRAHSLLHCEQ